MLEGGLKWERKPPHCCSLENSMKLNFIEAINVFILWGTGELVCMRWNRAEINPSVTHNPAQLNHTMSMAGPGVQNKKTQHMHYLLDPKESPNLPAHQ